RFFPSLSRREYSRDFISLMVPVTAIGGLVCLAIYVFSGPVSDCIFNGNVAVVKLLSAIIFIFVLDLALYSLLRSLRRMRAYSALTILQNVFEMGLAAAMVMMGKGVEGAVLALLMTRSGLLICLLVISRRYLDVVAPARSVLKKYVVYGLPTLPMVVSGWVLASFDRYMIALFYSTREVGFYDPAYTIGQSVPMIIGGVFSFTLTPHLSNMFDANDLEEVRKTLTFMTKLALAINVPFILGGIVLSGPVLGVLSTDAIAANAFKVLPMISIGVTFFCTKIILSQIWKLEKKTYKLGITYTFAALTNIVLNYVLIPRYGINGAAIATMLAYGIDLAMTALWLNRDLFPRMSGRNVMKITLSSALMFAAIYLSHNYLDVATTVVPIVLGLAVYTVSIRRLNILDENEREVLKSLRFLDKVF
ncbi:MAG TPA: polysaccharide biosynthesis C-terminal domain-containing protein, partial [Candidatus Methanofastidiosa archaeon]|nr:polysaccharide biosynthesis C-terminal domain-containing protein [Candidatus Methanofastidiosa archaeon]